MDTNDPRAHQENIAGGPHLVTGNKFQWYDHPGIGPGLFGYNVLYRKTNFAIKVLNGNKGCEVKFHIRMINDGHWKIGWGAGNF